MVGVDAFSAWRGDLAANRRDGRPLLADALTVRFVAVSLFRASQAAGAQVGLLGSVLKQFNHLLTGADISWESRIAPGLVLHHPTGVVIGDGVRIGPRCEIQQGVTIGARSPDGSDARAGVIGADVVIGAGARILGAVQVGDRSVIGANAVVLTDVPADSIAVGVPARSRARVL